MLERIITSSTTRVCAPGTWLEWTYGLVRFYRTEVSVERCIMWRLGRTTGSPEPIMLQIEEDYCLNKSINRELRRFYQPETWIHSDIRHA